MLGQELKHITESDLENLKLKPALRNQMRYLLGDVKVLPIFISLFLIFALSFLFDYFAIRIVMILMLTISEICCRDRNSRKSAAAAARYVTGNQAAAEAAA